MSDAVITSRSVHRHLTPHFDLKAENPIAKILMTHIEKHDFQRNSFLNKARYAGGMINLGFSSVKVTVRTNRMRIEREQTIRETLKALVYCASYKLNSNSLFEIKMSVKSLDKQVNQLHISDPTEKYRLGTIQVHPHLISSQPIVKTGMHI